MKIVSAFSSFEITQNDYCIPDGEITSDGWGGAGKRGQGRQQQCPSVKHLNVERSIFHSSGEKRSDGRKLIESFSLDGGAAEIFFFPFPPFFKKYFPTSRPESSHTHSAVCVPAVPHGRTSIQPRCNVSGPFHAPTKSHSHTHDRDGRSIRGERSDTHTHTRENKEILFWTQGGCV